MATGTSLRPESDQDSLAIRQHFRRLRDPRRRRLRLHNLLDLVVIALCGVLCGAQDWQQIVTFARGRHDWLKRFCALPHGIPSHDTFERVFDRINPQVFAACFRDWIAAACGALKVKQVALDGKSLRHSGKGGLGMLHVVSAWATANRLILGEVACAEKSNEITAIPQLLRLLHLQGAIVTIDAMGCQKEIAAQIRRQQGHYVLALKENHPGLLGDVQQAVAAHAEQMKPNDGSCLETVDQGHGRQERRLYTLIQDLSQVKNREQWADLTAIVTVLSERTVNGATSWEMRYYLTSYPGTLAELAEVIRGHWGIENQCHWVLDVTFGEDRSAQRAEHGAVNVAWLRRMALSLLSNEPTPKLNLKQKSRRALCDHDFLLKVLSPIIGSHEDT